MVIVSQRPWELFLQLWPLTVINGIITPKAKSYISLKSHKHNLTVSWAITVGVF